MRTYGYSHAKHVLRLFLVPLLIWMVSRGFSSRANEHASDIQKRLQRQVSITWKGQSLAGALTGLSDRESLSVWLDRRVDPEQSIELALRGVSLQQALEALARSCDLHIAYMGRIAYLGPDDAASEIMALREKLHGVLENSPRVPRQSWFRRSAWTWPRLSEPRRLLQNLFSGTPIKLRGVERVPYDLWNARQLPRMTRVDQATLLLIGFELTLQIDPDGKKCQVVPIERPVLITRQYTIRANQAPTMARLRRQFTDLSIDILGTERPPTAIRVTGAWSPQQQFQQALEGRPRGRQERGSQGPVRPDLPGHQVYSLEIREQSLRNVLQQLASQLPLELTWSERQLATSGHSLDVRISCKLQSVSLEQLLEAVLTPAGLHYQRVGREIRIQAAP